MASNKLTISVSHLIFLSREERYKLIDGETVKTLGVSLPVWFYKGTTSEPAEEVFCRYHLTSSPKSPPIRYLKTGYAVNLPRHQETELELTNEQWLKMTREQREVWYRSRNFYPKCQDLKDVKDGGAEYLSLKFATVRIIADRKVGVVHYVVIRGIENLQNSLTDLVSS